MKRRSTQVNRPEKPEVDPLLTEMVGLLTKDGRSNHAKAQVSGLSSSTLRNWQDGKVRRPQAVSLQLAARMLGYRLSFIPEKGK